MERHGIGKAWEQLISKPPQMSSHKIQQLNFLQILSSAMLLKIMMASEAWLGVTQWQLHEERLPGSPPPQCLSRCEAAGEEGGDAVMLVLQTRSKKQ